MFCYNWWFLWWKDSRSNEFWIRQKQLESRKVVYIAITRYGISEFFDCKFYIACETIFETFFKPFLRSLFECLSWKIKNLGSKKVNENLSRYLWRSIFKFRSCFKTFTIFYHSSMFWLLYILKEKKVWLKIFKIQTIAAYLYFINQLIVKISNKQDTSRNFAVKTLWLWCNHKIIFISLNLYDLVQAYARISW